MKIRALRHAILIGFPAVSLAGCLTATANIPVWQNFDACPDGPGFHEWVTCAKQKRQESCDAGRCSSGSNTVIAFVDGLDQSVQRHEMTETQARRKWDEFRATREVTDKQSARTAADRAAAAVAAPVLCTNGKTMGC
jgi:hypothetical protein